jgi:hypothetical protein
MLTTKKQTGQQNRPARQIALKRFGASYPTFSTAAPY